jgi:hypothetical protein
LSGNEIEEVAVASHDDRYDVLEAAPIADEEMYLRHMIGFVESFVIPARRHRWLHVLSERPKRASRHSHKLHGDLDFRRCQELSVGGRVDPEIKQDGVYYDFVEEPRILSADDADRVGWGCDAIFSVIPGRLAVFFFHECQSWRCRC